MKVPVIILASLFTSNVFSQTEKVLIKFCPLALADINMPTIQAGLEFNISNKISWYNEFGIKYTKGLIESYADTSFVGSRGYKIKSEIRHYFRNKEQFIFNGPYFAVNAFFIKDLHNREITYLQNSTPPGKTDDFSVKKNVLGFNLVLGYQKRLTKNTFLDTYGGLGIRFRNICTVHEEYNKNTDTILDPTDPNVREIGERADANGGLSVLPNLTLGIRICFRLQY